MAKKKKKKQEQFDIPTKRTSGILPEGLYRFRCTGCDVSPEEGPSGYHYLSLVLNVEDPEQPDFTGRVVYYIASLSPKARWKMEELLNASGAPEDSTITPDWFEGKFVWGVVFHDEYEGIMRAKVDTLVSQDEVKVARKSHKEATKNLKQDSKGKKSKKSKAEPTEDAPPEDLGEALDEVWGED